MARRTTKGVSNPILPKRSRFRKKHDRHPVIQKMIAIIEEFSIDMDALEGEVRGAKRLIGYGKFFKLLTTIDKVAEVLGYRLALVPIGRGLPDVKVSMTRKEKLLKRHAHKNFNKKDMWRIINESKRNDEWHDGEEGKGRE